MSHDVSGANLKRAIYAIPTKTIGVASLKIEPTYPLMSSYDRAKESVVFCSGVKAKIYGDKIKREDSQK